MKSNYCKIALLLIALEFFIAPVWAAPELAAAASLGDVLAVRSLLNGGADPDEPDENGCTPLLWAVFAGISRPLSMHFDVIELLTEAGADVNASVDILPPGGLNPIRTIGALHRTISDGAPFLEMSLLLLEKGADPNLPGAWGRPLHAAASSEKAGPDEVRLLLGWGADVKALSQWGTGPLADAVTSASPSREKIELLMKAGADVNAPFDWNGHRAVTPLMAAAMNASREIVRLLLSSGASRDAESADGLTARGYAIQAGRSDIAELL